MRILAVIFGIVLIVLVALDAFETIILPRRVTRRIRLARLFYSLSQLGWKSISHLIRSSAMRESFRGYVGPLTLLALLVFWAVLFVFGFGLLLWGLALPLNTSDKGFIFLALVVSYVPIIYQAFSRRELRISLLDARAGSPATAVELLRRNCSGKNVEELRILLHDWEVWCADILESHLSYPILAFYRSQHDQQSWVEALTVILDTCALILTNIDGAPVEAARFTFAMARHAVVDLAQVLNTAPAPAVNRLSSTEFTHLQDLLAVSGIRLKEGTTAEQKLAELRETYEPFVSTLAERIQVSLPPWIPPADTLDDWQTS